MLIGYWTRPEHGQRHAAMGGGAWSRDEDRAGNGLKEIRRVQKTHEGTRKLTASLDWTEMQQQLDGEWWKDGRRSRGRRRVCAKSDWEEWGLGGETAGGVLEAFLLASHGSGSRELVGGAADLAVVWCCTLLCSVRATE